MLDRCKKIVLLSIVCALASCGGSSSSDTALQNIDSNVDVIQEETTQDVSSSNEILDQNISSSTSVDCDFTDECTWTSQDSGLSITVLENNRPGSSGYSFTIESTRDTQMEFSSFLAIKPEGAELNVTAFSTGLSGSFTAGSPRFMSAEKVAELDVPHRTNFEYLAIEFVEQDGEEQYAVFENLGNNLNAYFCSSGFPCIWMSESNLLQFELFAVYPEPNETTSLEVGDGALSALFLIRNYTGMTLTMTSVGGANDFVAQNGLSDYQLFRLQRALSPSQGFILPAEQDFRDPDIALPVRPRVSPAEDLYSLLLTVPSGRVSSELFLEELSLHFLDEDGFFLESVEFVNIEYTTFEDQF